MIVYTKSYMIVSKLMVDHVHISLRSIVKNIINLGDAKNNTTKKLNDEALKCS